MINGLYDFSSLFIRNSYEAPLNGLLAYLDPGTGSMILQFMVASLVGIGYAIKLFWFNTKPLFSKTLGGKRYARRRTRHPQKNRRRRR